VNPRETRIARARLYALLSSLATRGPTPEALAIARELPALAPLAVEGPENLAAGHHAALSLASAAAYLSLDGLAGGPEPDQLGAILAALAEVDTESTDPAATAALLDRTLSWLPLLVLSVRDVGEPAWTAVVELALELCAAHRAEISIPRDPLGPAAAPIDLDAAETSLRSVARALCRPSASGWMPSGPAISRLATAVDLPGGMGDRAERLTGLLYAAADAGSLPHVCAALRSTLLTWVADLRTMERDLGIPLAAWARRAQETADAIDRVGQAAAST